ncbi:MAG: trypsin-like peptidase domain-containing protein [Clostridiales bacterium]|nr:trypsin-like peptidase domain-containing protein [Clostridiales bacterium]
MDDFEKNNEMGENETEKQAEITETPAAEESVRENAFPQAEEPRFNEPQPPVQPTYAPPVPPQTGYPYGQGAAPNTAYPYSPMPGGYNNPYSQQPYYQNPNGYPPVNNRPAPPKPKKSSAGRAVLIILIVAILGIAGVYAVHSAKKNIAEKPEKTTSSSQKSESVSDNVTLPIDDTASVSQKPKTSADALTATEIYDKVSDVSVGVLVYQSAGAASFASNLYGEGSGVITEENSDHTGTYVITCAHVVSGSGLTVKVQLNDGEQYSADIVGIDNKTDIAVLLMNKTGLKAASFGSTKDLKVGQTVYAIGNPGGTDFFGSFTSGIVSAIARPINSPVGYEMNCIQHDAAINPGNSGGALVNELGQVIGINSSKIAAEEYEGMGFAVPSETVKEIADELIAHGYVTDRAKLGITYATVSQSQAYSMVVQIKNYPAGSIIISSITSDSSLANTKAQSGDLIIKANGKELTSPDILLDLIQNGHVGDKIKLTLVRISSNYETTEFEVEATLVEDRGTTEDEEPASESEYFNPFDFNH